MTQTAQMLFDEPDTAAGLPTPGAFVPVLTFHVDGVPRPGGSKKAFYSQKLGRSFIVDTGKHTKQWRDSVTAAAIDAYPAGEVLRDCVLYLAITFWMPRPQGHFRTGKNAGQLKENAPVYHTSKPDSTKLTRSTEDALTGLLWGDDAQIAHQRIRKLYANPGQRIGAWIEVYRIEG